MVKDIKNKEGFTIIEVLLIVLIIGLLASIILGMGFSRARNKASINSYKTSMNSVQAAAELCGDGNRPANATGLNPGSNICSGGIQPSVVYPKITEKCGDMHFRIVDNGGIWVVTTVEDCNGCKIICTVTGCDPDPNFDKCSG